MHIHRAVAAAAAHTQRTGERAHTEPENNKQMTIVYVEK